MLKHTATVDHTCEFDVSTCKQLAKIAEDSPCPLPARFRVFALGVAFVPFSFYVISLYHYM